MPGKGGNKAQFGMQIMGLCVSSQGRIHGLGDVGNGMRYTHLTDQTKHHAIERINGLMDGFNLNWGKVK